MLPEITLREVVRGDVDRIAAWLADEEVSSRWFGHYACGDPVHRGYEPDHMLEAPQTEWDRVFRKLGFMHLESHELCRRPDGGILDASVLAMDARNFRAGRSNSDRPSMPVVTIMGLAGSGSRAVGEAVARVTEGRFVDDEIRKRMCRRLQRSIGELQVLEAGYDSIWSRMLRAYLAPFDKNAAYAVGHDTYGRWPVNVGYTDLQGYLSKEQYVKGLRTAVRELALDGDAVFHGHGARLFIPAQVEAFHVFVMASEVSRRRRYAVEQGLSAKNAARALAQVDRRTLAVHRHLLSSDPLDLSRSRMRYATSSTAWG